MGFLLRKYRLFPHEFKTTTNGVRLKLPEMGKAAASCTYDKALGLLIQKIPMFILVLILISARFQTAAREVPAAIPDTRGPVQVITHLLIRTAYG